LKSFFLSRNSEKTASRDKLTLLNLVNHERFYFISRADFWAYAGQLAVNAGVALANANCTTANCAVSQSKMI